MANQPAISSQDEDGAIDGSTIPSLPPSGPRKLIRPSLPAGVLNRRVYSRRDAPIFARQQSSSQTNGHAVNSHAEAFYLQKQMHAQTQMVFMLEGGERIEGAIEWYDTDTIKVRNKNTRTLIYKSAIKYLYKAADPQP